MNGRVPLPAGMAFHEGDGDHVHEMSVGRRGELVEYIWKVENVELTTVGIDIGSSTSHLMFAAVRLQRKTQALSSQFVVVERRILWKSPILITPFLDDGTIDAQRLREFVARCYSDAGLAPGEIDTGAVILTGEAIKRSNARAIADVFASDSGKFVCASAGHHLECVLAAHGSGAVAMSREVDHPILNVDIGGGTTKLAIVHRGEIVSTCAFAVGGRLIAFDPAGRIARIDESAQVAARHLGVKDIAAAVDPIVDALAEVAVAFIRGDPPDGLAKELLLTEPLRRQMEPGALMFSGGVSEYIYAREARTFGDIALPLARRIAQACSTGRIAIPVREPREGIRATVIGASQFTVQVSGKTIHIGAGVDLPLRNVPVVTLPLTSPPDDDAPIAVAIHWHGDPEHAALHALAEEIAAVLAPRTAYRAPVVLIVDADIARTLGHILEEELQFPRPLVCIDGIALKELDFVDVGEMIRPADVVPVVIKSLLFSATPLPSAKGPAITYKPVMEKPQ